MTEAKKKTKRAGKARAAKPAKASRATPAKRLPRERRAVSPGEAHIAALSDRIEKVEKRVARASKIAGKKVRRVAGACKRRLGIQPGQGWTGFSHHWRRKMARGLRRMGHAVAPPSRTRLARQ